MTRRVEREKSGSPTDRRVFEEIGRIGVVPVAVIDNEEDAQPLGAALLEAGLPVVEVTFRTGSAAAALATLSGAFPDMVVGAGTVLSVNTAAEAIAGGASFIVSPGYGRDVVDHCLEGGIPVIPGVLTPTEISMAAGRGLGVVKLFPSGPSGGVEYLRAVSAPFPDMRFIPTGGVTEGNLPDYLRHSSVLACGGSWMVKRELIAGKKFGEISRLAKTAVKIVSDVRGEFRR